MIHHYILNNVTGVIDQPCPTWSRGLVRSRISGFPFCVANDSAEFERQLKDQEEGLNSLTVDEFITNRNRYLEEGRAFEGNAAQKLARQAALKDKVMELRKQGSSRVEANEQAEAWLKDQAALHKPDQIAGGNPHHIGGMGDRESTFLNVKLKE